MKIYEAWDELRDWLKYFPTRYHAYELSPEDVLAKMDALETKHE